MAFSHQPDRSRTLAPLLGALAIAVVVLAIVFTVSAHDTGSPSSTASPSVAADKALACPRSYPQPAQGTVGWVPRTPYGLNGDDALVPEETPTHAVVCAYLNGAQPGVAASVPLSGRRVLIGSLAAMVRTLSSAARVSSGARACTEAVARYPDYLLGLSYGDAALWVSAPADPCVTATNGSFRTSERVSPAAAASYAARRWVG